MFRKTIQHWLLFLRWHTAALTMSACIIGYLVAGGNILSIKTLFWAIFGLGFHAAGFAMNNLCDYKIDLSDSHKKTHPLVSGKLNYEKAWNVVLAGQVVFAIYGTWLTNLKPISLLFLIFCIINGWLYNWLSKKSLTSPIWISFCFGFLPFIPYFSVRDDFTYTILLIVSFAWCQIFWQIAFEGYKKDLDVDKINMLKRLGMYIKDNKVITTLKSTVYGYFSKIPMYIFAFLIISLTKPSNILWLPLSLTMIGILFPIVYLVSVKEWEHDRIVRCCALTEILTYFLLVMCLQEIIGWFSMFILILFPLIWFCLWNKIYWKDRWIAPNV